MRHFEVALFWRQDSVVAEEIEIAKVSTEDDIADALTRAVDARARGILLASVRRCESIVLDSTHMVRGQVISIVNLRSKSIVHAATDLSFTAPAISHVSLILAAAAVCRLHSLCS